MKTQFAFLFVLIIGNTLPLFAQPKPISVELNNNGNKLDAKFYVVGNSTLKPTLILLHGFPGNDSSPYGLADRLGKSEFNILVFNYEGSFNSEGVFTFENCMMDIGAAISFLKKKETVEQFAIDTSNIVVCGCSMGAAFALSAAIHNQEIKKVIAVVGGNDLSIYLQKIGDDPLFRNAFEKRIMASVSPNGPIKGDSAYVHQYFNKIISRFEYFDIIKNANAFNNKEILFITGWLDTLVPMEEFIIPTYRHLKAIYPESIFIQAMETDHFFTNTRDELANAIIEWVQEK